LQPIKETIKELFGEYPASLRLSIPPNIEMGDFTIECFPLSKQFKLSPDKIASPIAERFSLNDLITKVQSLGPYLNLKINNAKLFEYYINIINSGKNLDEVQTKTKERFMVEYLSPNTNKPLHLGHMRNGSIGMAISNLLKAVGNEVIKTNLVNDRGIHICKSMLAWQKWAECATPQSTNTKGDHFVGKWYVRYAQELDKNPDLEQEAQELLKKWEAGDQATVDLWKTMNQWVLEGFNQTYQKFGLEFDAYYYESNTYLLGKDIIADGLKKQILTKNPKGNTVFQLPADEFGLNKDGTHKEVTVLRPDGTSVYMTQDLGTTVLKFQEHNLDQSIFVVGSEQEYHFKCLFAILKALGFEWADKCFHLSYAMVYLPEGKMKSREGKVVDADDLIQQMTELAAEEIKQRDPQNKLSTEEIETRAKKIAVGAIKYYFLSVKSTQDIHFDPKASISFDGSTGPYCQYAYARIFGILENAQEKNIELQSNNDFSLLGNPEELLLIQKLIQFPGEIVSAIQEHNPSKVANQVFEIAKSFNQFYNKHRVISDEIGTELTQSRLALIKATAQVLKQGLNLLGIEVLERM